MKTGIAVDIDGVIAVHNDQTIDLINGLLGTRVDPKDMDEYYYGRYWSKKGLVESETMIDALDRFCEHRFADPDQVKDFAPSLPSLRALTKLAGMSEDPGGVTIVTARAQHVMPATKTWLDRYGVAYARIVHTVDKPAACQTYGLKFMIEDSPSTAVSLVQVGVVVFLIDWPYNRHIVATGAENGIYRVETMLEVPALIETELARSQ